MINYTDKFRPIMSFRAPGVCNLSGHLGSVWVQNSDLFNDANVLVLFNIGLTLQIGQYK